MPERDYDRALGAIIRRYRAAAGLSQTRLGEKLGVTFQQIQKYERGGSRVAFGRLVSIADALGVPADLLVRDALELIDGAHASREPEDDVLDRRSMRILAALKTANEPVREAVSALLHACTKRPK